MLDLLMNRRSIRNYADKEVEKEKVDEIVQAALTSPSGRNKKPWDLVVVQDRDILASLGKARGHISAPIGKAKLGIVVTADPEISDLWVEDSSIMGIVIQLAAQSLELSSCWIQVRGRLDKQDKEVEENVKEILNIPKGHRVQSMIAISYSGEELEAHDEEKLSYNKVHYDKF